MLQKISKNIYRFACRFSKVVVTLHSGFDLEVFLASEKGRGDLCRDGTTFAENLG